MNGDDQVTTVSRWMLPLLCGAAFLLFVQAFMVAPLLPKLARELHTGTGNVGLAVPAYLIPYGLATLVWGPLSDRIGRRPIIIGSMVAFVVLTAATAGAGSVTAFVLLRAATGVGASGVVPISLTLVGDLVAYDVRGRAFGWLFGSLAGGIAVGSTAGALLEPLVGWRGLFIAVAVLALLVTIAAARTVPSSPPPESTRTVSALSGYVLLLGGDRGRRTYAYVAINAIVQSGIYTWLGLYLERRFALGPTGIGLVLFGYGVPGFLFGPLIGRIADRRGRALLIPLGVGVSGLTALGLGAPVPLGGVAILVAVLSLGYDLTQPLLAGIVTDLPGDRGLATGLMAFLLFTGFGFGSLIFQLMLPLGFSTVLVTFGVVAVAAAAVGLVFFRDERPTSSPNGRVR